MAAAHAYRVLTVPGTQGWCAKQTPIALPRAVTGQERLCPLHRSKQEVPGL